eukprot:Opistho-2@20930
MWHWPCSLSAAMGVRHSRQLLPYRTEPNRLPSEALRTSSGVPVTLTVEEQRALALFAATPEYAYVAQLVAPLMKKEKERANTDSLKSNKLPSAAPTSKRRPEDMMSRRRSSKSLFATASSTASLKLPSVSDNAQLDNRSLGTT